MFYLESHILYYLLSKDIWKCLAPYWIFSKLAISHLNLFFLIKFPTSGLSPFIERQDKIILQMLGLHQNTA